MKIGKEQLKSLLKECILELVQEGKLNSIAPVSAKKSSSKLNEVAESVQQTEVTPNTRLNEAVKLTTQLVSKGDSKKAALFEKIIQDTAQTTLQKQLASQMTGGGALMEGAVLPEERELDTAQLGMFAANKRWAQLAFGGKTKNSNGE